MPKFVKNSLEKGKGINGLWNDNKLNSYINDCINIEENINEIKKTNDTLQKSSSKNINIKFVYKEDEINNIFKSIKEFWKINFENELFDSKIESDKELVKEWLNRKEFISELLFRKSKDGETPKDFHNKCDNKGITILIVETTKGYKLRAYTELNLDSNKGKKKDNSTFIFF